MNSITVADVMDCISDRRRSLTVTSNDEASPASPVSGPKTVAYEDSACGVPFATSIVYELPGFRTADVLGILHGGRQQHIGRIDDILRKKASVSALDVDPFARHIANYGIVGNGQSIYSCRWSRNRRMW